MSTGDTAIPGRLGPQTVVLGLLLIILFQVFFNLWWLAVDDCLPILDANNHFTNVLRLDEALSQFDGSWDPVRRLVGCTWFYPPLAYTFPLILFKTVGISEDIFTFGTTLWLMVMLVGTYVFASDILGRKYGLLATLFVSLCPAVYTWSRTGYIDVAMGGTVAWTLAFWVKSRNFHRPRWTLLFALGVIVSCLTKQVAPIFLIGPVTYSTIRHFLLDPWRSREGQDVKKRFGKAFLSRYALFLYTLALVGGFLVLGILRLTSSAPGAPARVAEWNENQVGSFLDKFSNVFSIKAWVRHIGLLDDALLPSVAVLFLVSVVYLLARWKKDRRAALFVFLALFQVIILGIWFLWVDRYFLPVIPLYMAVLCLALRDLPRRWRLRQIVPATLAAYMFFAFIYISTGFPGIFETKASLPPESIPTYYRTLSFSGDREILGRRIYPPNRTGWRIKDVYAAIADLGPNPTGGTWRAGVVMPVHAFRSWQFNTWQKIQTLKKKRVPIIYFYEVDSSNVEQIAEFDFFIIASTPNRRPRDQATPNTRKALELLTNGKVPVGFGYVLMQSFDLGNGWAAHLYGPRRLLAPPKDGDRESLSGMIEALRTDPDSHDLSDILRNVLPLTPPSDLKVEDLQFLLQRLRQTERIYWESFVNLSKAFDEAGDYESAAAVFIHFYERDNKREPHIILYILIPLMKAKAYDRVEAYCREFESWYETLSPEERKNSRWAHGPAAINRYRETIAGERGTFPQ
jgi:4-amino-4-deoxy-L-arabinose transferase-like glycosyltransferase